MIQNSGVEQWPAWEQWTLDAIAAKVHRLTLLKISDFDSIASQGIFVNSNAPRYRLEILTCAHFFFITWH
jgi:hypothetical protein